jgi:hypothetical protein
LAVWGGAVGAGWLAACAASEASLDGGAPSKVTSIGSSFIETGRSGDTHHSAAAVTPCSTRASVMATGDMRLDRE